MVGVAGDGGLDDGVAGDAGTAGAAGAAGREFVEGDGQFEADRLPGPLRQAVGAEQPQAGFFQRVVLPLRRGAQVFGAAPGRQAAQHGVDGGGAAGGQVTVEPARAAERPLQPDAAVGEPVIGVAVGGRVAAEQFLGDLPELGQGRPAGGRVEQQPVGGAAGVFGEPV